MTKKTSFSKPTRKIKKKQGGIKEMSTVNWKWKIIMLKDEKIEYFLETFE